MENFMEVFGDSPAGFSPRWLLPLQPQWQQVEVRLGFCIEVPRARDDDGGDEESFAGGDGGVIV